MLQHFSSKKIRSVRSIGAVPKGSLNLYGDSSAFGTVLKKSAPDLLERPLFQRHSGAGAAERIPSEAGRFKRGG